MNDHVFLIKRIQFWQNLKNEFLYFQRPHNFIELNNLLYLQIQRMLFELINKKLFSYTSATKSKWKINIISI